MNDTTITLPLTPAKIRRAVCAIVEKPFPLPRQELCLPLGDMEQELTAYAGELVQAAYNDAGTEAERYRTEAREAAEDSGRRMRLIVQLYDALCEAPRTPKVESALNAVDAEARRSPWMAERVGNVVEVQVADHA